MILHQTFSSLRRLRSVHLFPLVVLCVLLILTALRISGSSVGMYHEYLYGSASPDKNLLYGKPQPIRSDEWLVSTPLVVSQSKVDFAEKNPLFGTGKDVDLITDAPYRGWSILFRPQLLGFFVMPLENAFAFRWWCALAILLIAAYYFTYYLFSKVKGRTPLSILLATAFTFNPFIFWWYQNGTIVPLAMGVMSMLLSMLIIDKRRFIVGKYVLSSVASQALLSGMLFYSLVVFGLALYPPFQIPIALVVFFFIVGYAFNSLSIKPFKLFLKALLPIFIGAILAIFTLGVFIYQNMSTIHALSQTVYPGARVVTTGGFPLDRLPAAYTQFNLQRDAKGAHYRLNQSEDSDFTINMFSVAPLLFVVTYISIRNKRSNNPVLVALSALFILFFIIMFIPRFDWAAKLTFLSSVPHERILIGGGLAAYCALICCMRYVATIPKNMMRVSTTIFLTIGITYTVALLSGFVVLRTFPQYISNPLLVIGLCTVFYLGLFLLFSRERKLIGGALLAIFSIACVYKIQPLYVGLSVLNDSPVTQAIQHTSTKTDVWGVVDAIYIENLPQVSGRHSFTGVLLYPDIAQASQVYGKVNEPIYNRYAHTFLATTQTEELRLVQPDVYSLSLDSCEDKSVKLVNMLLSVTPIDLACYKKIDTVTYPKTTWYIYKRTY